MGDLLSDKMTGYVDKNRPVDTSFGRGHLIDRIRDNEEFEI